MGKVLTIKDIEWIQVQYPTIKINTSNNTLEGEVAFSRSYEGYHVSDTYIVKIFLDIEDGTILPKVYEVSDKIAKIAKAKNKDMSDLHINPDGSFCLCIPEREEEIFEDGFTIQEFFKQVLEHFLFQMSFYAHEGYFPWGEYAHGYLGHLEVYAEGNINFKELIKFLNQKELKQAFASYRQNKCLCGSGEKLRVCHPLVFQGVKKLKSDLATLIRT